MNLSLAPEVQDSIDQRVRSGRYRSAEDVVAAAVASLEQQERLAGLSPNELEVLYPRFREKLDEGIEAARGGRLSDGEEFFDALEREEAATDAGPDGPI